MMEKEIELSKDCPIVYPMEESWDILIVLDACRFDYMAKVYQDYLRGKISKRISPGSYTLEWASKVFPGYYDDCIYVSGNPFIGTSKKFGYQALTRFEAAKHFYKVVEVWKSHWDNKLRTVRPESVSYAAIDTAKMFPDKRLIVHFMQPHYPYIALEDVKPWKSGTMLMTHAARSAMVRILGPERGNRIATTFAPSYEESLAKKIGVDRFRMAYESNLRIAMKSVAELLNTLRGKAVICSDHGELLGEEGKYGHPMWLRRLPEQLEIPWIEVIEPLKIANKELARHQQTGHISEQDELSIETKLRALGYD